LKKKLLKLIAASMLNCLTFELSQSTITEQWLQIGQS
jgi:hypothetical protein